MMNLPGPTALALAMIAFVLALAGPVAAKKKPDPAPPPSSPELRPTVLLRERDGRLEQRLDLIWPRPAKIEATLESSWGRTEASCTIAAPSYACALFVPACEQDLCRVTAVIASSESSWLHDFDQPRARRWTVVLSPFSHIDIGFTNSQRHILAQNLDNIRAALDLIDQTRDLPALARFKFFTEVSWPASVFLASDTVSARDKDRLRAALKSGEVELGGLLISHQDKFMPAEALFRSPETALRIGRDTGAPVRTACLNDLTDMSVAVRPLHAAGITYLLAGTNTSHYLAPPLFYLQAPTGDEKILVWLAPNLNGYGENFDFAMRPNLPLDDAALAAIEDRLSPYLASLETAGAPPSSVAANYDFFGAHWPYPYDVYFLPYYPAHAVDNGPQDATPSELVRAWNERWAWPRLVIQNPGDFFAQAEAKYRDQIPTLRGDLPGFWGEQVFFAFAQTDPAKEAGQREFERNALLGELAGVSAMFHGQPIPDLAAPIANGYKLLTLNNDHNPGPVPFGNTKYTKEDTAEWKRTRREWADTAASAGRDALSRAQAIVPRPPPAPATGRATAADSGDAVVMDNEFYRVEVDKTTGGVRSLVDKELGRELAASGPYQLNQYVVVARGEDAGTRGNVFTRPGFKRVTVSVAESGPALAAVEVTGPVRDNPDEVKTLTKFIQEAFGIKVPGSLIRAVTPVLKVKLGPVKSVRSRIELRPGAKAVYFIQTIATERDQAIDHCFAYYFAVPPERPLIVEGAYTPYRFGPVPPWGDGDLIPAAKMVNPKFPGINALTQVFGWIYGLPADAVFRSYVLAPGDGFGIAFSSRESGAVFPGPPEHDPLRGPFGGGFFHLALGWTAYGHAFLGAPREGEYTFHSALTSFPAADLAEAKTRAARFGHSFTAAGAIPDLYISSNPAVLAPSLRPLDDHTFLIRLYETSGRGAETVIAFPAPRSIKSARRAREDGEPGLEPPLALNGNGFAITLGPGEVATVRVELK
jgi:hypothetical protein